MVFQSTRCIKHVGITRTRVWSKSAQRTRTDLDERINSSRLLGIGALLKRSPSALSGASERVALGRALIREPKTVFDDEPLSNLDAALRFQMRAELIRLHSRLVDTTTVYVTHDK